MAEASAPRAELARLTISDFAPRVGEMFRVELEARSLELTLDNATASGAARAGARAPFALLFLGPLDPILPQHTYTLANRSLGTVSLFMVPLGPAAGHMRYEAIFG